MSGDTLCLGIDGGQTTTRAALVRTDGHVVMQLEEGGLVHILSPGGRERVFAILRRVHDRLDSAHGQVAAAFLALTGVDRGASSQIAAQEMATALWPAARLGVDNDGLAAWAGGTGARPGVAAMAGTGSVVVAVNERGQVVRTGGWGYLFGDPGSGWNIGSRAITEMLRRRDRGQRRRPLDELLLSTLGVLEPPDVPREVYAGTITHVQVARLAQTVALAAARGDEDAQHVLAFAAANLAADVALAIGRLEWTDTPLRVAMVGRIFQSGAHYRDPFRERLQALAPTSIKLSEPVLSNLGGAVLQSMRLLGVPITNALCQHLVGQGLHSE